MYALTLDENNRCLVATYPRYASADAVIVEFLPDGNLPDYRYIDDKFIYDPLPEEPAQPDASDPENVSVWDELDAAYQEGVDSV